MIARWRTCNNLYWETELNLKQFRKLCNNSYMNIRLTKKKLKKGESVYINSNTFSNIIMKAEAWPPYIRINYKF